ncbi:MAG: fibronectin type III domain-containing protein [Flavobacteriaceae bacterium]|jgi:hypothetical protein|nr:fibronectin type III domain-containing protein [Flavobacteriaceae bacterium]
MKRNLFFMFFLSLGICINSQNRKINLNEGEKINVELTTQNRSKNNLLKAAQRARIFTISKSLQSNLNIGIKDTLSLDLFTDKKYKAYIDKIETDINGNLSVRARLVDYPMGYCIITTSSEKNSLVFVEIPELNERYISRGNINTTQNYLLKLDENNNDELECDTHLIPPADSKNTEKINKEVLKTGQKTQLGVNDPAQIDVMILYTPKAKEYSNNYDGGIDNTISLLMSKAELVLANSNVGVTISMVHSGEINYTESGSSSTDLNRLTGTSDGFMDEVHQWRDKYKADLVVLLAEMGDAGGLGWLLSTMSGMPNYGFSLSRVQQASWTYTTIHEIGHNMGNGHHKQQTTSPGPGIFDYSAGWRWDGTDGNKYCSVMTYDKASYFADGIKGTRVPYFSNPSISYLGSPTGHNTEADAARTLRETKHIVAAYRENTCIAPSGLDVSNISFTEVTLNWAAVNVAQSYTVEYKISTASAWTVATSNLTTNTYILSGLVAGASYNLRVKANCSSSASSGYTMSNFTTLLCGTPSDLSVSNITDKGATLKWTAVSGAKSYTVEYKTSAASTWTVATSTLATNTYTLSGLTDNTTYNWRVKTNCFSSGSSGSSEYANGSDFITSVYCISKGQNTSMERISKVVFGNISNTSQGTDGYENFIATSSTDVTKGKTYTISITPWTAGTGIQEAYAVFIDFNHDGIFNDKEETVFKQVPTKTSPVSGTITIPTNALSGATRMRVSMKDSGIPTPCEAIDYGQVEDYTVNIVDNLGTDDVQTNSTSGTLYPNPVKDILYINGINSGNAEYTQITIIDRNGKIVKTTQAKVGDIIEVNVSDLPPSIYYLNILGENHKFIKAGK